MSHAASCRVTLGMALNLGVVDIGPTFQVGETEAQRGGRPCHAHSLAVAGWGSNLRLLSPCPKLPLLFYQPNINIKKIRCSSCILHTGFEFPGHQERGKLKSCSYLPCRRRIKGSESEGGRSIINPQLQVEKRCFTADSGGFARMRAARHLQPPRGIMSQQHRSVPGTGSSHSPKAGAQALTVVRG